MLDEAGATPLFFSPDKTEEQSPVFPGSYLILELEISSSRCIKCRSPPSFSLRFSVTWARKGFLASNGLEGMTRVFWDPLLQAHEAPCIQACSL